MNRNAIRPANVYGIATSAMSNSNPVQNCRSALRARFHAWRESVDAKIPQPNPDFVPWT